jgi:uncharacterized protein
MSQSALFVGRVVHERLQPARHRLSYRVFMGLFDLDELTELDACCRGFGYNRRALISFYDRDHGDGTGAPLRSQIEAKLVDAGFTDCAGGPIQLLAMPRVLGYVFNPLSVYFCHAPGGELRAVVHEVNNTFGGRHFYVLPADAETGDLVRQSCEKRFRVSPFLPDEGLRYQFSIRPPGDTVKVAIAVQRAGQALMTASFKGVRRPFTAAGLAKAWLTHPLLTYEVIAGIHWEALLIWLKISRPRRPAPAVDPTPSGVQG